MSKVSKDEHQTSLSNSETVPPGTLLRWSMGTKFPAPRGEPMKATIDLASIQPNPSAASRKMLCPEPSASSERMFP